MLGCTADKQALDPLMPLQERREQKKRTKEWKIDTER